MSHDSSLTEKEAEYLSDLIMDGLVSSGIIGMDFEKHPWRMVDLFHKQNELNGSVPLDKTN
jgi:hypothetical protein